MKNIKPKKNPIFANGKYHLIAAIIFLVIAAFVTIANLGTTKELVGDDAGVTYHYSDTLFTLASNTWESHTFPGRSNVIATISLIHVTSINTLNKIGVTPVVLDRLYYGLFFFLSGLGMYFLIRHILGKLFEEKQKAIWLASITGGIFYILNNFTMILLSFPPTTYLYSYILFPWIFLMYLKDYHIIGGLWKKLIFALVFLLIFSGNPANTIGIVAIILIYEIFFRKENKIIKNWKGFLTTLLLILLVSSYIILPVLGNRGNPYGAVVGNDISITYNSMLTSIGNLLRFRGHPAQDTFVFSQFLESNKIIIANYLLLAIAFIFLLKRKISRMEIYLFLIFLLTIFLAKAEHTPFSIVNKAIFAYVPFFEMFRASYYKFIIYSVFSISILLPISLLTLESKDFKSKIITFVKKYLNLFVLLLILFSALPFFRGDVVMKIHKTIIPQAYHDVRSFLEEKKTDFAVLSLPQTPTGITMDWGNGNYYGSAGHPDMFFLNRPDSNNSWFLDGNPTSNELSYYKNILQHSHIKYIFVHKDIPESYSFEVNVNGSPKGQTSYKQLDEQIVADKDFSLVNESQYFKLYELRQENFIPHLSVPKSILISDEKSTTLLGIDSRQDWPQNTAVFFTEQNLGMEEKLKSLADESAKSEKMPDIEFKKISPTKYRVVVHHASEEFPLVFSESFDNGWKIYNTGSDVKTDATKLLSQIADYKILNGNEQDQATADELKSFIEKGIITTLGDDKTKEVNNQKYQIDFVSKDFQGSIQNENLKNGTIFETWFKTPLSNGAEHLKANGYANSWSVDPGSICSKGGECTKNADGTYDMELVIEFWPQRLFYIGLALSGITIIFCLGYVAFRIRRNKLKKSKGDEKISE